MTDPLVLLHGFTGSPEIWQAVRDVLSPACAVFAPALLGHVGGPAGPPSTDFDAEVDRIANLVAARFTDPVHLVGYSMGARVALGLAVRHPERLARATLIGVHPGLPSPDERASRARADERWCELLETGDLAAFATAWQAQPLFASQRQLPAPRLLEQQRIRTSHDPHSLSRALRCLGLGRMPCYRDRASTITTPVTLVSGGLDGKFSALAADLRSRLPNASTVILPDVGHNPVLECPEVVAATLERGVTT